MSRWFRHYAGMMRDDKLVRAAVRSKQPVERVVWVWGAILESAAEINDNGRFEFDVGEAAYFLRCDDADLACIIASLADLGRITDGVVARWGDRQFASDAAAERQRRYRERKSGRDVRNDDSDRNGDVTSDVTRPSPDGEVTPQETETDTETDNKPRPPVPVAEARALFDEVWAAFPQNPTSSETKAIAAFSATKAEDRPAILAAARRYRQWFTEDNAARDRTEQAGLRFAPHLATWLQGAWREAAALPVKSDPAVPVVPTVRLDRVLDADLFAACEKVRGKPTPSSPWSFSTDIVEQAKASLAGAVH